MAIFEASHSHQGDSGTRQPLFQSRRYEIRILKHSKVFFLNKNMDTHGPTEWQCQVKRSCIFESQSYCLSKLYYSLCCLYLKIAGICDYLSFYLYTAVFILIGHRNLPHGNNSNRLIQHVTKEQREGECLAQDCYSK